MKVKILNDFLHSGVNYIKGAEADFEGSRLAALVSAGLVEAAGDAPPPEGIKPNGGQPGSAGGKQPDSGKTGEPEAAAPAEKPKKPQDAKKA